jgi:hypothetical protein
MRRDNAPIFLFFLSFFVIYTIAQALFRHLITMASTTVALRADLRAKVADAQEQDVAVKGVMFFFDVVLGPYSPPLWV